MASNKTRRIIALGAFAAAAVAGPAFAAATISTPASQHQAYPGECLAWFGNQEDGKCLSYSNGQPIGGGTPWGIYGPNNYQNGALLPGQTFNRGVN